MPHPLSICVKVQPPSIAPPRVLLVDDDKAVCFSLALILRQKHFEVVTASSVREALRLIASQAFDVLLSDLHMPNAGDGLTVVSAMRHSNPDAVTLLFSGYPEMQRAVAALLLQADEILLKPMHPDALVQAIQARLRKGANRPPPIANLADILKDCTEITIAHWLLRVRANPAIVRIAITEEDRSAHLPQLFFDLITRLLFPRALGTDSPASPAATLHGGLRRMQGYSAAMMVEESRMLQVSIFETLQNNLGRIDFSFLLLGVMTIADEVDAQLAQAMNGYLAQAEIDALPVNR